MDKQLTYFDQLFVGRRRGYTAGVGCVNINDEGISKFFIRDLALLIDPPT